eukprot:COSAG02_NODE_1962_length_10253_cov_6.942294_8_plen_110_part_00
MVIFILIHSVLQSYAGAALDALSPFEPCTPGGHSHMCATEICCGRAPGSWLCALMHCWISRTQALQSSSDSALNLYTLFPFTRDTTSKAFSTPISTQRETETISAGNSC